MVVPIVVPTYAAILTLIYVFLSARVVRMRGLARINLGHGDNPAMERRIRVHGNFAEYVPLALLLLAFMEMQAHSRYILHILCIILIVARIVHAIGVTPVEERLRLRIAGAAMTFFVLIVAAIFLLINGLRAGFI